MKAWMFVALALLLLVGSCAGTQSLQEYFVDNAENPNFLSLDIPTNILNLEEAELSDSQREVMGSLRKLNILAFRKTEANQAAYSEESAKVKAILKNPDYKELMKLNTEYGRGVVKYLGEGDTIDEVVIFGDSREKGFALVRVLGKKMNPAQFVQVLQAIQSSDLAGQGLGDLAGLLKG
jgi:hypothetical protein